MTRRAVLGAAGMAGASVLAAGCSASGTGSAASPTASPSPADPETALVTAVIAGKEQLIARYQRAGTADSRLAAELEPFVRRHQAHVAALRKFLPPTAAASGSPSALAPSARPSASGQSGQSGQDEAPTVRALRDDERRAAGSRPRQVAGVSPALAQLLSSVGACEAVHAVALGKIPA